MKCSSIDLPALMLLHQESLEAYGGQEGVRDMQLLDAAMGWPLKMAMQKEMDIADFAAAYAAGILRHKPFVDGNERTALLAMGLFLTVNGWQLYASPVDAAQTIQAMAAGAIEEDRLANWIRTNL